MTSILFVFVENIFITYKISINIKTQKVSIQSIIARLKKMHKKRGKNRKRTQRQMLCETKRYIKIISTYFKHE